MPKSPVRTSIAAKASKASKKAGSPLPTDLHSVEQRRAARNAINLEAVSLQVVCKSGSKTFKLDFSEVPEGGLLLRQLLFAAHKQLGAKTDYSFTVVQDTYYGIEEFLHFAAERKGTSGEINSFRDVGVQTARDFSAWCLRVFPGRAVNRKRYAKIKQLISSAKKKYSDQENIGSDFVWPVGPRNIEVPVESYRLETFNELVKAALDDMRVVMAEIRRFPDLVKSTLKIRFPDYSLADAFLNMAQHEERRRQEGKRFEHHSQRTNEIRKRPLCREVATRFNISIEEFISLYLNQGDELSRSGVPFPSFKVSDARLLEFPEQDGWDIACVTMNALHPDWPLGYSVAEADSLISFEKLSSDGGASRNPREMMIAYRVLQRSCFGSGSVPIEGGLMALIARKHFTAGTLYPFFLYVQLNTGWNEEVVLSLTVDLDRHVERDILDPDYVVIWGWKDKVDKSMPHRSNIKTPMSVYNVLKFVQSVARGQATKDGGLLQNLWQFVPSKNLWQKYGRMVSPATGENVGPTSTAFLARHGITLDSTQKVQRIDARRIRTTCETRRKEAGASIDEISTLMGHDNLDTTDASYDSDEGSSELKNAKIRVLQERFVNDFSDYQAALVSSTSLQALRDAIASGTVQGALDEAAVSMSESDLVCLLSPKGQTYVAACVDRQSPTWPRAREFVPEGADCCFFNRCCLCKQGRIFKEALPFVARRVTDLEQLKQRIPLSEWLYDYGDESAGWQGILRDWNNPEEVRIAKIQSWKLEYSLPLTMRGR